MLIDSTLSAHLINMLTIWTVGAIVILYLCFLFAVAFLGDKYLRPNQQHPYLYSLGLGVHCTSWAFFGTTTQALQFGWPVVPTYAGIIMVMAFMFPVLLRINRLCQQHSISSLADFVALRYQRSHMIAALISLLCFIGVVPYIALQLDAITKSIALLAPEASSGPHTVGMYVAALMALFAILFGTRSLSLKEKHPGLLLTIAVESVLKLAGLTIVGIFVCYSLFDGPLDLLLQAAAHPAGRAVLGADTSGWVYAGHMLLGVCSMFVLPRQFHMNFVECNGEGELRTARWLFPLYLLAMTVFVLPIALAGSVLLDTATISSDAFVLALPLASDAPTITLAAFVGGLSATTSMIIVATLALGIMIANNVVTPLWLRARISTRSLNTMRPGGILTIRRATVLVVLSVAYWYHLHVSQSAPLVKSGIIAIALLGQMLPAMLLGLYWSRASLAGAGAGLLAGLAGWLVWVLYPSVLSSYYFDPPPSDAILARGFVLSLLANVTVLLIISLLTRPRVVQTDSQHARPPLLMIRLATLMQLTERVLDSGDYQSLQAQLATRPGSNQGFASAALLNKVEQLLAGQVGTPGARVLLSAIAEDRHHTVPDLVEWAEEASVSFQFNHEVLQSSVQHIEQGICVLDHNLCLLAWNQQYATLFDYPPQALQAGMTIHALLAFNARRGLLGDAENVEQEIAKRIAHMQAGTRYKYVRRQPDGKVIELHGSPLPGGGYVTTYSDISEHIKTQQVLEQRVRQRTQQLQQAQQQAEQANESKTRFLAAAGHDLMQPFNAATLFAALLTEQTRHTPHFSLSQQLQSSLQSAEALLSTLLDMSRLDSGVMQPDCTDFALQEVLGPLSQEFAVIASQKGLSFRTVPNALWVHSDPRLLRRIVQNLVANAIRYTRQGTVLLGARRVGTEQVAIWVCDTGPGIAAHHQQAIFAEFHQLEGNEANAGLGLGLTIVERMSQLLGHPVNLQSRPGFGTRFTVTVPRRATPASAPAPVHAEPLAGAFLPRSQVLLIENDTEVAEALALTLTGWGAQVLVAADFDTGQTRCPTPPDLMIVDYHLNRRQTGTEVASALRAFWQKSVPGILNTAKRDAGVKAEAAHHQLHYLPKPVKLLALKKLLREVLAQ